MSGARARHEEAHLIEQAQRGDQLAFGELVERYQLAVYNLCYRMLGQSQDAEDAAQEVFLRVYRQLGSYKPSHRFSTWVLSIASHYCIDQLRKRRLSLAPLESIVAWARSREAGPDEVVVDGEERDQIQRLLAKLPEKYRLALILRYWYDLSYAEIAEMVKLPENTVKTRLHRARQMMAGMLEKQEMSRGVVSGVL
jgi:RNA polymerase sigma-70 factor (ECF subfamily)